MRFTVDRTALVDKLNILSRGVSVRSALPVLSGVLVQAADGRLDLYATDMELSIKASLKTTIVVVTHELASIFAIGNNSVYLDVEERTMTASGDPRKLRESSPNPRVHKFLTRGEEQGQIGEL